MCSLDASQWKAAAFSRAPKGALLSEVSWILPTATAELSRGMLNLPIVHSLTVSAIVSLTRSRIASK